MITFTIFCLQRIFFLVIVIQLFLMTSCGIAENREDCDFNTRVTYRYMKENPIGENLLPLYIHNLSIYVFDERDVLIYTDSILVSELSAQYDSEINLPEGEYTLIAWGNKAGVSRVNEVETGKTTRKEMELFLDQTSMQSAAGLPFGESERLYYGHQTFAVVKNMGSRVNMDMAHSHCVLNVTAKWKNRNTIPNETADYYMLLKGIPSRCSFLPGYVADDIRLHLPTFRFENDLISHSTHADIQAGSHLVGQFVTYRYGNDSHPLLSIHTKDKQVMKEINLRTFFRDRGIELDTNLRQEFTIEILIDVENNTVSVALLEAGDWEEGGPLG